MTTPLFQEIGVVRTPFTDVVGMPIQPAYAEDARGVVEVVPAYQAGLRDLAGFERIWLIYVLHAVKDAKLVVTPFRDTQPRGIFATRSPCRPNPIGLSCVRLLAVHATHLEIAEVDMLDNTPVLDIKPYVPAFDAFPTARAGWFDAQVTDRRQADARFT